MPTGPQRGFPDLQPLPLHGAGGKKEIYTAVYTQASMVGSLHARAQRNAPAERVGRVPRREESRRVMRRRRPSSGEERGAPARPGRRRVVAASAPPARSATLCVGAVPGTHCTKFHRL